MDETGAGSEQIVETVLSDQVCSWVNSHTPMPSRLYRLARPLADTTGKLIALTEIVHYQAKDKNAGWWLAATHVWNMLLAISVRSRDHYIKGPTEFMCRTSRMQHHTITSNEHIFRTIETYIHIASNQ